MNLRAVLVLVLLLLPAAAATCGKSGTNDSSLADLRGKTIAVVSLLDMSTLELRYVLQQKLGLDASRNTADVTISEVAPESMAGRLTAGLLDAALLPPDVAYTWGSPPASHISREAGDEAGGPLAASALVSYWDVVEQKGDAIAELDRLLARSATYLEANRSSVLEAVATAQGLDLEQLRWRADRLDLPLGDLSAETTDSIVRTWRMAAAVGDLPAVPDVTGLVFSPRARGADAGSLGRATISLALLDDPTRRVGLYAIEQGIAASDTIDVNVSYLSARALAEAASTRQYDVVEVSPLVVSSNASLPLVIVSAGALDVDGALLYLAAGPNAD
jgi:ABC-type nitrate/sulfonate/bicarbonate transport system substrate-binding protein